MCHNLNLFIAKEIGFLPIVQNYNTIGFFGLYFYDNINGSQTVLDVHIVAGLHWNNSKYSCSYREIGLSLWF